MTLPWSKSVDTIRGAREGFSLEVDDKIGVGFLFVLRLHPKAYDISCNPVFIIWEGISETLNFRIFLPLEKACPPLTKSLLKATPIY